MHLVPKKALFVVVAALAVTALAQPSSGPDSKLEQAAAQYRTTHYAEALAILKTIPNPGAAALLLTGQVYYGLEDYKQATGTLEQLVALTPRDANAFLWLGRAYGRRAETSSFLTAPRYASKTRQFFEKAVELDAANLDAADDLLEYYLEAPGFLGGGLDKAEALAAKIRQRDPARGEKALAKVAEKGEDYVAAEAHYRKAWELAPGQVGRTLDLARFLGKRGRSADSDALFTRAVQTAPDDPNVGFVRAKSYIEQERNLADARSLLERYIASGKLTPDHPSRTEARDLLKKAR